MGTVNSFRISIKSTAISVCDCYLQDDNKMIEITIMTPEKAVGVKKQGKWLPLITNIPNFLVITQKH